MGNRWGEVERERDGGEGRDKEEREIDEAAGRRTRGGSGDPRSLAPANGIAVLPTNDVSILKFCSRKYLGKHIKK